MTFVVTSKPPVSQRPRGRRCVFSMQRLIRLRFRKPSFVLNNAGKVRGEYLVSDDNPVLINRRVQRLVKYRFFLPSLVSHGHTSPDVISRILATSVFDVSI